MGTCFKGKGTMAGVFGVCRQCGAENAEFRKNGNNVLKQCQGCANQDSLRRKRLMRGRRRLGEGVPVGKPCACCRKPMQRPALDHDHKTGFIREWLCHNDNLLLGTWNDDPLAFLEFAAQATDRAAKLEEPRRTKELDKAIGHLNRAAYLLRHCS